MKQRIAALCAALALLLALPARATTVMVASDIHYLARELYEGSELFLRALRAADGKLTQHGDELMAALVREALRLRPDALVVTGDLSFNGERASHEALAKWFSGIEARGIPVWVIPGNHDINCATARGYGDEGWYPVESVTPEGFSAIYADFMLPAGEGANLSYLVRVDERLCLALVDVAFYQDAAQSFGLFHAGHAAWLEDALRDAGDAERVTATHHSLLPHTQFARDSFLMFGSDAMVALARRCGVRLNLSGHVHAQHIAEQDGLADAATGALCAWPHRYALLTLGEDGDMTYEARSLDEALLPEGFMEMSADWYDGVSRDKTLAALEADGALDPAEARAMADYAARFNRAYFSGTYDSDDPSWRQDAAYALWCERGGALFEQYLGPVMDEPNGDNLYRIWEGRTHE